MDDRTLEALRGSIRKWERVVSGEIDDNCPLCGLFLKDDCRGCPVAARTSETACRGSPFEDYQRNPGRETAVRELEFLRSLLPESGR